MIWTEHRGLIPEGHNVGFIDGDKGHVVIDNLICLPISEMTALKLGQPIPIKHCPQCDKRLVRRRSKRGVLEHPSALKRRQFCNSQCFGLSRRNERSKPHG